MEDRLAQLDSHIEVVTPENIEFEYRVASPFERLTAYVIDQLLIVLVLVLLWLLTALVAVVVGLPELTLAAGLIIHFLLMWFYAGLFETFWNGQTPGKRSMGLRVLGIDGRPITADQAILRNFLRAVDAQPFNTYLIGLLATATNRRYQRLGDLACGTMVVVEEQTTVARFNEITDVDLNAIHNLLPANATASRSLAKAISRYVDRRRIFGPERRKEIARHVGEVLVEQYNLPRGIDHDALLCAFYQRTFLSGPSEVIDDRGALPSPPPSAPLPQGWPLVGPGPTAPGSPAQPELFAPHRSIS